jgi:hypothetical protein
MADNSVLSPEHIEIVDRYLDWTAAEFGIELDAAHLEGAMLFAAAVVAVQIVSGGSDVDSDEWEHETINAQRFVRGRIAARLIGLRAETN